MRWFVSLRSAHGISFTTLACLFAISGCAIQQPQNNIKVDIQEWLAESGKQDKLTKWQFNGRFSAKTDIENWTGSIDWRQINDQYSINISGPLNSGSAILKGSKNHAEFILSDTKFYSSNNAQTLLYEHTGLILPVEELQFWLLGLPAPDNNIDSLEVNTNGLARKFSQNNWDVIFKRYKSINNRLLPNKIFLAHQDINVRLIIQKWQINGD